MWQLRQALPSRGVALAISAGFVVFGLGVPRVGATVPGTNGRLAYDAKIGNHSQLFTIDADGNGRQQLTRFTDSDALWAAWSPSGNQLAFERDVYAGDNVIRAAIYTMDADGSGLRSLTPKGLNGQPSWSPNGRLIVYSTLQFGKEATVSVIAASGGRARKLIATPLSCNRCDDTALGSATFSPDGKRIAFVWHKGAVAALFTINASGGGLKQVTPWYKGGIADKIDWSPGGRRLLYSRPEFGQPGEPSSNVYTIGADGTHPTQLTYASGGTDNNGADSWSPDGTKVAYVGVGEGAGGYAIFVMNADGGHRYQLTHGPGEAHRAAWGTHR